MSQKRETEPTGMQNSSLCPARKAQSRCVRAVCADASLLGRVTTWKISWRTQAALTESLWKRVRPRAALPDKANVTQLALSRLSPNCLIAACRSCGESEPQAPRGVFAEKQLRFSQTVCSLLLLLVLLTAAAYADPFVASGCHRHAP